MARSAPWYRFHVDRWEHMTRNLEPIEMVVLLTIFNEAHRRSSSVPEDIRLLAHRVRVSKVAMSKAIDRLVAEGLLERIEGGLFSDYIADEIAHREKRVEQAGKSAEKRWKSQENQQNDDARTNARRDAGSVARDRESIRGSELRGGPKGRPPIEDVELYEESHSTLKGSAEGDAPYSAPIQQPRRFYAGMEGTHPELGDYTVLSVDPLERKAQVRFHDSGKEVKADVRPDDTFADDDLDDTVPF